MEKMTTRVKDLAVSLGAVSVGISTLETLAGGPPSADLTYVQPSAKSAISFAVPLHQEYIEPFLRKEDRLSHERDNIRTNTQISGMSLEISSYLRQKGFPAVPLCANIEYRTETPNGVFDEKPPLSHRYLAVRSGVGYFGLSGNVITPQHGAAVILGTVVTEAELTPTDPLPPEDNYCDECKRCMAACASGFMNPEEKTEVRLGGVSFTYAKRRHHNRCDYVCGGFTGLHKSGKWSTWSPARFPIPEHDEEFLPAIIQTAGAYRNRPRDGGGFLHFLVPGDRIELTCGHCAIICHPDREVRENRFRMLTGSGVVIQHPDGRREAVSPEAAKKWIADMPPEQRALYEKV